MIRELGAGVPDPRLSVVVTLVDGVSASTRVLDALLEQDDPPPLEIVVPYDDTAPVPAAIRERYSSVHWLPLGTLPTGRPPHSPAGQHELYDRRRACGLAAATGDLVALLEDRGAPARDWARAAARLHAEHPHAAIGGAVEPEPAGLLAWARWVCDFSRYALPFRSGEAAWVTDVNVVYKRRALEATRAVWRERYHEPAVHWALLRSGEELYLASELVVRHRPAPRTLGQLLRERLAWGRLFGAIRARHASWLTRGIRVAASPFVPFVLLVRHAPVHRRRGEGGRFVAATPLLLLLLAGWALGEALGLATGRDG